MGRAPCCEKVGLKKGRWTAAEDEILLSFIAANGEGSWRSLPRNAGLLRCGKSCRLWWINYLRSDLKRGNFTEEEEIIINLQNTLGNRWSQIAGHLPGRTDNEIKNYWNSHILKKIHVVDHQRAGTGGETAWGTPKIKNQKKKKRAKATASAEAAMEPAVNGAAAVARANPSVSSGASGGTVDGEIINETDQIVMLPG